MHSTSDRTSLEARLAAIRARAANRIRAPSLAVMHRATEALQASGLAEQALGVGDPMPPFSLGNQEGETVRSEDLVARGPLVLTFFRGVWCPYCNAELVALQAVLPQLASQGATLVAMTPQRPEHSRALIAKHGLTFDLLRDPGNDVAASFRLTFRLPDDLETVYREFKLDLPAYNGDESWTLPMPARYVIESAGVVRDAEVNADYTRRPEPALTVAVVKAIAETG